MYFFLSGLRITGNEEASTKDLYVAARTMEDMNAKLDRLEGHIEKWLKQCSMLLFFLDSRLVKEYYLGMEKEREDYDRHNHVTFSLIPNPQRPRIHELAPGGSIPVLPNLVTRPDTMAEQVGITDFNNIGASFNNNK